MNQRIDLHLHSTCSDGTFTPREVVRRAADAGLSVISLTDHDSTGGVAAAQEEGARLGVEVVPGTELSAQADGTDVHILGYFIDPDHPDLIVCLNIYRQARLQRAERVVKKLNRLGLRVSMEKVLAKAGPGAIGRPHIADAMVEEGLVFSVDEAFHRYLGYSKPAFERKYSLSPSQAIQVIRAAGGLACVAHPGLYRRDDLIPDMVSDGLDGIEVRHTKHNASHVARYSMIARENNLLCTGGSDCHGDGRGDSVIGTVEVPLSYVEAMRERLKTRES
jgi:predicted metal-dependent phosphoesterase TrpH